MPGGTRSRATKARLPVGLGVWEELEEGAVLRGEKVKVRSNELVRAEWSPQNFETTLGCWEAGIPHPGCFRAWRARECGWRGAAGIPNTGFCRVEVYVCVLEEVDLQAIRWICRRSSKKAVRPG